MEIVRQISLEVIDFWSLPSIPKISEPFETFLELFSVVLFYAELKVDISDMLVSFGEVIILELWCMVDSMESDELFCKLEMNDLIFSEYSLRTHFQDCL